MTPRTEYTTPKGTVLPIMNMRGKEYLEVKYRVVWFLEENHDWSIETEFVERGKDFALAKATIKDSRGRIRSTAHKYEDRQGFGDFIEKSETSAIGRALANLGYGTQFCADEMDEGDRIVDSPGTPPKPPPPKPDQRPPKYESLITADQQRVLFEISDSKQITPIEMKNLIFRAFKIENSGLLKKHQYDALILAMRSPNFDVTKWIFE